MPTPVQLQLPFACLDFPARGAVSVCEIAAKLGCSDQHILNLIDDGRLSTIDLARHEGGRRMLRVLVDDYRAYVLARLAGAKRREFVADLPLATQREILADLLAQLPPEHLRGLAGEIEARLATMP